MTFKYGMKRDFNNWLASLGPSAPVKSLTELRDWNIAHGTAGALKYGQSNLDISDEMDLENDRARYEADRAKDIRLSATHGIDEVMKAERLDALLFPGSSGAAIAATPGYPTVIVPFGLIPNAPIPAFSRGVRRQAAALRRQLHRHGVQRAASHRARLRVRTGDEAACATRRRALAAPNSPQSLLPGFFGRLLLDASASQHAQHGVVPLVTGVLEDRLLTLLH